MENLTKLKSQITKRPIKNVLDYSIFHNIRGEVVYSTTSDGLKTEVPYIATAKEKIGVYVIKTVYFFKLPRVNELYNYYHNTSGPSKNILDGITTFVAAPGKDKVIGIESGKFFSKELVTEGLICPISKLFINMTNPDLVYPKSSLIPENKPTNSLTFNYLTPNKNETLYTKVCNRVLEISSNGYSAIPTLEVSYRDKIGIKKYDIPLNDINSYGVYVTRAQATAGNEILKNGIENAMLVMRYDDNEKTLAHKETMRQTEIFLKQLQAYGTIEEKKIVLQTLMRKLELEEIKGKNELLKSDAIEAKARVDAYSSNVKSAGILSDVLGAGVNLLSKFF